MTEKLNPNGERIYTIDGRVYDDMGFDVTDLEEYGRSMAVFELANRERERRHERLKRASSRLAKAIEEAQAARTDLLDATRLCEQAALLVARRRDVYGRRL